MRTILQRVTQAKVEVNGEITGSINQGLVVLAGFEESDTEDELGWVASKICKLRIFDDSEGTMNLSIKDIGGNILLISQFTLHAKTKKGNRPSYIKAARPEIAEPLFNRFKELLEKELQRKVETGIFGAKMLVSLANQGPVTIFIDSKNRE